MKSPAGTAITNIRFSSGNTNSVNVTPKLPELAKKTGRDYTDTLLKKAGVAKDLSAGFTHRQWSEVSAVLAKNAKGKVKAFIGKMMRPNAEFCETENPILQANPAKGTLGSLELWELDGKGQLVGPFPFPRAKKA